MTIDELRIEVKRDLEALGERMGGLASDLAGMRATLEGEGQRARDEIGALFARTGEHGSRLGAIERDYTPRPVHEGLATRVAALETASARAGGVMLTLHAAVTLLGMGGLAALMRWMVLQ